MSVIGPGDERMGRAGLITLAGAGLVALIALVALGPVESMVRGDGEVRPRAALPVSGDSTTIKVATGANGDAIARQMESNGIITDAGLFSTVAGLMGVQNELAAGEYEFTRGLP